jgi:hypothetical protein
MVWRGSRRYGLVTYPIFTTVRHIAREYKGIMCRGSPVPLCKGTGTKQLKVDYFACATCVLQFADSLLKKHKFDTKQFTGFDNRNTTSKRT